MGTHLKSLKSNLQKIEMLRSTLVRLGGPAKPVFTKRTGRNPYFINPEQQMANGSPVSEECFCLLGWSLVVLLRLIQLASLHSSYEPLQKVRWWLRQEINLEKIKQLMTIQYHLYPVTQFEL